MKITARRRFAPQSDEVVETDSSAEESSSSTILEDDRSSHSKQREEPNILYPYPPTSRTPIFQLQASQNRSRLQAHRELQYITEEAPASVPDPSGDPYAQDALGIAMLLEAARVIEDRERAQALAERDQQLDGSAFERSHTRSGVHDSEGRFHDTSDFDCLSNTTTRLRGKTPTVSSRQGTPSLLQDPRNYERRRSGRLASAKPTPKPTLPATTTMRRSIRELSQRSNSEQPKPKPKSKPKPSSKSNPTPQPNPCPAAEPATATASPNDSDDFKIILRHRIQAIEDKNAATARGKLKRLVDWDPVVREYLVEQQAKRRKTMQWLAEQEESEGSEEEGEAYDPGVEGGVWIESEGEDEDEHMDENESEGVDEDGDEDGAAQGTGHADARHVAVPEIPDSQDDAVDDALTDTDSDPIVGPSVHRRV